MQKRRAKGRFRRKIQPDCDGRHVCSRRHHPCGWGSRKRKKEEKGTDVGGIRNCAHCFRDTLYVGSWEWFRRCLLRRQYGFRRRFIWGPAEKIETCSVLMSSRGLRSNPDHRFDLTDPAASVSPSGRANKPIVRLAEWWLISGNFSSLAYAYTSLHRDVIRDLRRRNRTWTLVFCLNDCPRMWQ